MFKSKNVTSLLHLMFQTDVTPTFTGMLRMQWSPLRIDWSRLPVCFYQRWTYPATNHRDLGEIQYLNENNKLDFGHGHVVKSLLQEMTCSFRKSIF